MPAAQPSLTTLRRELAAAFRLAEKFGYSEGICNHFSVVVPDGPAAVGQPKRQGATGGKGERYLINPYGLHWSEMRPEHLLLIDGEGRVVEGEGEVEATARNIHIAGHRANPRHACILHVHMPWATSLTMLKGGRLEMAHMTAARFHGRVAYQSYGGIALDEKEGERLAEIQKSNQHADVLFLMHHGVSIGGPTIAFAFDDLYYLERACRQQVLAMSTGRELDVLPEEQVKETARQYMQILDYQSAKHFQSLMRINGL